MLPPFIIDQIRRREEQEHDEVHQPQRRIELPLPERHSAPSREDEPQRGVVVIDLG